jgi:flavorubredoxin
MTTTLIPSKTRLEPTRIAPETFLIHDHAGEGQSPMLVPLNAMVIRGSEPVVVDTGVADNEEQFLADVFSLVDPADIRWVFISHDDIDHTGNANRLMELAPNATLIVNWFLQERMGSTLAVSPLRQRWVGDGETIDVGDRKLIAIRPPVYDSPTTRGLFDPTTGVYWASDAFASPMITPIRDVCELDQEMWSMGMPTFNRALSPWIEIADEAKFLKSVDRIAQLGASTIAACHTPVISRAHVATALEATRRSLHAETVPLPDQTLLDQIQLTLLSGS